MVQLTDVLEYEIAMLEALHACWIPSIKSIETILQDGMPAKSAVEDRCRYSFLEWIHIGILL